MAVRTSAGTTIGIVAAAPATFDVTGYEALTFVNIGEITDLGEFGREYNLVTHNPIATRGTVKKKGSFSEGSMALTLGLDTDDAGQILAKTASNSDSDYSFAVETQNGDIYYFRAQVMMFKVNLGSVDSITTANITLEITTNDAGVGIIEDLAV
jgi:hypothetical protein